MRDVAQLWQEFQAHPHSLALRNELVERFLPLVRIQAQRLMNKLPQSIEIDDLISSGCLGLMEAVAAYVPGRGVKFSSYSALRIRGAMLDDLRKLDWVPRLVRVRAKRVAEALETLNARLGRQPTHKELARSIKVPVKALDALLREIAPVTVVSFDAVPNRTESGFEKDSPWVDAMSDRSGDAPETRTERREMFARLCRGLNKTQRLIVIGYYFEQMSMKEIGQQLGCSESRISQSLAQILAHLRKSLNRQAPELLSA
jgi:RNA polymerase sigma factor FliA